MMAIPPRDMTAAGWRVIGNVPPIRTAEDVENLSTLVEENVRECYGATAMVALISWRRLEE